MAETARDDQGRYLPGNPPGPGRPRRKPISFVSVAEEFARDNGLDVSDIVKAALRSLIRQATQNDNLQACKLLLERLCGPVTPETAAAVQVNVGSDHTVTVGPPVPDDKELSDQLQQLVESAAELRRVDFVVKEQSEIDDLMR